MQGEQELEHTHGGRVNEAALIYKRPAESFIDFSSNLNVFCDGISSEDWAKWKTESGKYPDPEARAVRARLATVYETEEEWVLPTAGAIEALYLAARLFHGKRVAVMEPGFGDYFRAFTAAGADIGRVSRVNGRLAGEFDAVVLGNPNNPDGNFFRRDQLPEQMGALIVDEAFIEFVPDGSRESLLFELSKNSSVIILRSLTKSWRIPGLRLGFLATSNRVWMQQLRMMQPPWSVGSITAAWAEEYLTRERHFDIVESLSALPRIREAFQSHLRAIPGIQVHSSQANFFLIELKDPRLNGARLFDLLAREGYLIRVCDSFHGLRKGAFVRLAVRTERENAVFAETLNRVTERERKGR